MTPRRTKNLRMPPPPPEPLTQIHPHAAGIDIHLDEHWVAVPPDSAIPPSADPPSNLPPHVRKFRTCTADLEMLADWLTACGITTVAMESTGIYWIPLFELLERRGFQVNLIDPRQTKHVPGRPKSDCLDCQWIQRLHSYGLLAPSFRPADDVVVLRSYLRQRLMLISYGSQHVAHMHKALPPDGHSLLFNPCRQFAGRRLEVRFRLYAHLWLFLLRFQNQTPSHHCTSKCGKNASR